MAIRNMRFLIYIFLLIRLYIVTWVGCLAAIYNYGNYIFYNL